ncbi:Exonuclease mut-7-like protein [Bienertia sinuspersici]
MVPRIISNCVMGLEERDTEHNEVKQNEEVLALSLHAFSDLSCVTPVVFLYLLKESYIYGKSKATTKFRALQQQVNLALRNTLNLDLLFLLSTASMYFQYSEAYADGFSHLIVSALRKYLKANSNLADLLEAQDLAAQLFLDVVQGTALRNSAVKSLKNDKADVFMEKYIHRHIESQSYMAAVSLLEQFGICHSGESFLFEMLENKDFRAAEKWASYMGKSMLGVLVQEYVKLNMLKGAYGIIKRNNLQDEFPDIYHKCKESSLKTLAEKDVGMLQRREQKMIDNYLNFVEYLVYLAMEAGYSEKVDELCERYSLEGFVKAKEPEVHPIESRYLHLHELFIDDIIWVDGADSLEKATSYIEGCKVVGVDCEWKPNYVKGNKGNKVSIMQIASEKVAFIFDLIKLYDDAPDIMNSCLIRILHSPRILKLVGVCCSDAVVLVHLFHHIGNSQPADIQDKNVKMEWKSHIVSAPAKSNSNESLFKAVIGIWGWIEVKLQDATEERPWNTVAGVDESTTTDARALAEAEQPATQQR